MRCLLIALAGLFLIGCETTVAANKRPFQARVTFYHSAESKYSNHVAMSSHLCAREGTTVATSAKFPFGSKLFISKLKGVVGTGLFEVQDRGRDVERKKASHGRMQVIDVFVSSKKKYKWLQKNIEPILAVTPL